MSADRSGHTIDTLEENTGTAQTPFSLCVDSVPVWNADSTTSGHSLSVA
jgi:hypothetical protein